MVLAKLVLTHDPNRFQYPEDDQRHQDTVPFRVYLSDTKKETMAMIDRKKEALPSLKVDTMSIKWIDAEGEVEGTTRFDQLTDDQFHTALHLIRARGSRD
jgi:hypothetical protein